MGDDGCDIKPKGLHVHMQMKRAPSGHGYLPIGRFGEAMTKMEKGHMMAAMASKQAVKQQSPFFYSGCVTNAA